LVFGLDTAKSSLLHHKKKPKALINAITDFGTIE
jgi:hypothetical protein